MTVLRGKSRLQYRKTGCCRRESPIHLKYISCTGKYENRFNMEWNHAMDKRRKSHNWESSKECLD